MGKITDQMIKNLTEKVKSRLNPDYSDENTDRELEANVSACAESLIAGGTPLKCIEECDPLTVQTICIMVLDLSEETPGYTKISSAANYFALQRQLGVNGDG